MNILMASLLKRPVTAEITAARPRVMFDLIQGLQKKGHTVTLIGTGDSNIPGVSIIPVIDRAIAFETYENEFYAHTSALTMLAKTLVEIGNSYDIIHNHTYPECINLLVADRIQTPMVTTIHAQPFAEFDEALSAFGEKTYLVAISEAQKQLLPKTHIHRVVYNGIDTNLYSFCKEKEDYLLWLGRMSKAKNPDGTFQDPKGVRSAIALAQATDSRLLLSGNVEDMEFFEKDVKPHLSDKIRWVGPVSGELSLSKQDVVKLMQHAKCLLMPINWHEPFGLVMAEAMSCGTPVIGFDRGAVREVVKDGMTGFIIKPERGVEGFVQALAKLDSIDPNSCREHIVNSFSLEKMTNSYEELYVKLNSQSPNAN